MTTIQERIFAIADQLTASGQRPTLAAVRKALGGGSYTTLQQAMSEWKAARQESQPVAAPEAPPPSVTERMTQATAALWQIALETANARLAAGWKANVVRRLSWLTDWPLKSIHYKPSWKTSTKR